MKFKFAALAISVVLIGTSAASGQEYQQRDRKTQQQSPFQEQLPPVQTKEELEKKFQEMLSGVTLKGHYTTGRDNNGAPPKEDKYAIESVSKLSGDLWKFEVKIQYSGQNAVIPLHLRVVWAGDTPVITLDKLYIPTFGTFTARVMFYDGRYMGMWDGGNHGGLLYGTFSKDGGDSTKDAKDSATDSAKAAKPDESKSAAKEPANANPNKDPSAESKGK